MQMYEKALYEILSRIAEKIPSGHVKYPVKSYIAGGTAVYLYTKVRASDDVDMIISNKIEAFPQNLSIQWTENGESRKLYYDYTYNQALGLMHEDYDLRANLYKTIDQKFEVYLLAPIDLIISKLLRFEENDESDIKELLLKCNINRDELSSLATDAINVGVGFKTKNAIQHLEWVMEIYDEIDS